jgi:hypothetical protein
VEERDSRLQQPNRRGKGSVVRASQEDGESNRGSVALLTIRLYQTILDILPVSTVYYSLIIHEYAAPCFLINSRQPFVVNNHLAESGKASCRPWSSQLDHPGHISSLFHTQAILSSRPMHLHCYLCESSCSVHIKFLTPR